MKNSYIYACTREGYDVTRWLEILPRDDEFYTLGLTDLCMPGKVSELSSVNVPQLLLKGLLAYGPIQITLEGGGYCLVRRTGDMISLEFRSSKDLHPCRAQVKVEDVATRLNQLERSSDASASVH